MANHLRICIVGGRSFGKTALVKAVAHIPCFVVRNYKGAATRLQEMSFDDSAWEQTKWDDVKDWQFKFTVEEEGKTKDKILSFADYAGEYFEEDYEDSPTGIEENKVEETKVQKLLRKLWPWGGHKKAKRQINKLFYHPDGIIILLPRDFGMKVDGKDFYKRSLYEKRVLEYLEKVRPGTPVQIVISKWDLNDEQEPQGASAVEILSSPAFKTCYERILNGYRSSNGTEYDAGVIGISKKEKGSDGQWIDSQNKAYNEGYNVRELFTKLSHAADVARTERLKVDWASAKWWKRWFVMPWRSLGVHRKNSDDKEVKGILTRAWLRFLGFVAAAAIITCTSMVSFVGLTEKFRLDEIEADIAAASTRLDKVTKEKLVEMDYQLGTNKWIHPIFFLPRLSELKVKLNELNTKYVAFLEKDLDDKLEDPCVKVGSPWEVSPDVRLGVASNRLSSVEKQIEKLPGGIMSSEAISQRLKTEEAVLADLNRDVEFDKALYGLSKMGESQKLRGMAEIRISFQYMKSYRTNDFECLDSAIASLEKEQSTTLSNTLAQLEKEYPAGDLSVRRTLAQRKIEAINNALTNVFILGSVPHKEWSKELEVVKSDMATDEHYDPFDRKYEQLGKNDLKAIAAFKEKHRVKDFPNRKDKLADLDKREAALIEQIMEGVKQNEKNFAYDDKGKSFKLRIEQAENLTNAYSVALGKLRKSDKEYIQIDTSLQSTVDWISGHEKYIEVENAWSSAMNEPETNKVQALVTVLTKYDNDLYSEATNLFAEARTESERLSALIVLNCTNNIAVLRNKQVGGIWQVKVKNAQERINKIQGILPSVLAKDKSILEGLIKEEREYITLQEKEGKFIDRYELLIQMPPGKDLLGTITNFRKDFKEKEYPTHKDDYVRLSALEKGVLDQIEVAFTNELSHIPNVAVTNFLARQDRSLKIKEASERALESIPEDHPAAQKYRAIRDTAERGVKKFAKWVKMRETAKQLILFAEAAESKKEEEKQQARKLVISRVGGFYDKYHEIENPDDELHEIYVKIKDALTKAEVAIQEKYQERDEIYARSAVEMTGEDEKIKLIKCRIALIDEYLPVFLKDSNPHSALIRKRDELSHLLNTEERDKLFKSDHADCIRKLESKISTSDKIDIIEEFVPKYNSDVWLSKPNVKAAIESMEQKKNRLKFQKQFEELEEERTKLFEGRPAEDEDDSTKLVEYKRRCSTLKERFAKIKQRVNIQNRVELAIGLLEKEIKWIDGKLGDGSWSDINKMKLAYIDNPSLDHYTTLMNALNAFDPLKEGNSGYKNKVDDLKRAVENDWRSAAKVDTEWEEFEKDPNRANYAAFVRAYSELSPKESDRQQQGVRVKSEMTKVKYSGVADVGKLQPKITLVRLSFHGTVFSHSRRNSHIHLTYDVGEGARLFVEATDMPDVWDSDKACGTITGEFSRAIPIGEHGITFSILNETGTDETGQINIPIWEILADGVKFNGAYTYPVKIYARKTNPAVLTFEFSGLPTLKKR